MQAGWAGWLGQLRRQLTQLAGSYHFEGFSVHGETNCACSKLLRRAAAAAQASRSERILRRQAGLSGRCLSS